MKRLNILWRESFQSHSVRKFRKKSASTNSENYVTDCAVAKELPPWLKLLPLDWK